MSIRDELEAAVSEAIKRLTFAARGDRGVDVRAAGAVLRAGLDAGLFDVAQQGVPQHVRHGAIYSPKARESMP